MKKWQQSWLILLASSLAIGWIAQGEATLIRIGGQGAVVSQAQPVQVIIIDSNGNTYEQNAYYDPSAGGVDIDTRWAGPGASIYIPALGLSYLWYNGFWVDQEGYYWSGPRRVYISDPQWKEHWNHYWHEHHHDGRRGDGWGHEGWDDKGEDWRSGWGDRGEGRKEGHGSWGHEGWHDRGDGWRGDQGGRNDDSDNWRGSQGNNRNAMRSGSYEDSQSSNMGTGRSQRGQSPDAMRSGGFQGRQSEGRISGNPRSRG